MPAIQSLTMTYDALNEYGAFSEGDTVTGKVTVVLSKETTVESLFVKAKGDAQVRWTKKSGDRTHTYSAHNRYFKLKQFLILGNTKVPQGTHVYSFSFNIPPGSMPSSFKGSHGKIVYKLEAKLSRSWRLDHTVEKEIHFVCRSFPKLQYLMSHQAGSTNKKMGFFSKGNVHMDVILDRRAYALGETMAVVAKINNSSSNDMTPKFSLIQDVVYHANGNTKYEGNIIHKVVEHCIKPQTRKEVKCTIQIPRDQIQTIPNCDIISVEYNLKVYLDISFASDPEVMFPVVIFPPDFAPGTQPGVAAGPCPAGAIGGPSNSDFPPPAASMGPYPAGAIGGPSNSDFPPPAASMGPYPAGAIGGPSNSDFPPPAASMGPYPAGAIGGPSNRDFPPPAASMGPYPAAAHSGSYGDPGDQRYSAPPPVYAENPPVYAGPPGVYPAQSAHMSGGYPVPQLACPYGPPFSSSSSSSSVLHPAPPALTFQPPPCAPEIHPLPSSQPFNISSTAPTYNLLPSAPTMNTDFLSQSDEAPPAYSILFPSSATEKSDVK